jgi:glutathione synthase/RimK-type ligase-like ATP-grasp enzyme
MLAVHNGKGGFHPYWKDHCLKNNLSFKIVDCYSNDIIQQLEGCTFLFWHFTQSDPKDIVIAKSIMLALEHSGFSMFPDFYTAWHFDDKVAQKYLLEALKVELVRSYVFVRKEDAIKWCNKVTFPKVFKLRGGAGSSNVKLVRSRKEAKKNINKAFSSGFSPYNGWGSFFDTLKKYRNAKVSFLQLTKSLYRAIIPPEFVKAMGKEFGYVYFQDFIPNNNCDYRVIVIGTKAFAIKRGVRAGDFRASGSGFIEYSKELFNDSLIRQSFSIARELKSQCVALDFVINEKGNHLLVEISFGFAPNGYIKCEGFWDDQLNWHPGKIDPYGWMIELAINGHEEHSSN